MKKSTKIIIGILIGVSASLIVSYLLGNSPTVALVLALVGAVIVCLSWKKALMLLLAVSFVANAGEPEPIQPAGGPIALGIGLGLLIGSGYVAVRVVRACAKRKYYPTNAPPENAQQNFAGLMCYNDYCISPASETEQHGVMMNVILDDQGSRITSIAHVSELVPFETWNEQLTPWGLQWTGSPNDEQYAKDGRPASKADVPFRFLPSWIGGVVIHPEQPTHYLVLQESHDLRNWQNVFTAYVPTGLPIEISDEPQGEQTFYRLVSQ